MTPGRQHSQVSGAQGGASEWWPRSQPGRRHPTVPTETGWKPPSRGRPRGHPERRAEPGLLGATAPVFVSPCPAGACFSAPGHALHSAHLQLKHLRAPIPSSAIESQRFLPCESPPFICPPMLLPPWLSLGSRSFRRLDCGRCPRWLCSPRVRPASSPGKVQLREETLCGEFCDLCRPLFSSLRRQFHGQQESPQAHQTDGGIFSSSRTSVVSKPISCSET